MTEEEGGGGGKRKLVGGGCSNHKEADEAGKAAMEDCSLTGLNLFSH